MDKQQVEVIADTLCNIFDWDSQNPLLDFMSSLNENDISISNEVAKKIYEDFINLDALTRCSPEFDYQRFILGRCIS